MRSRWISEPTPKLNYDVIVKRHLLSLLKKDIHCPYKCILFRTRVENVYQNVDNLTLSARSLSEKSVFRLLKYTILLGNFLLFQKILILANLRKKKSRKHSRGESIHEFQFLI